MKVLEGEQSSDSRVKVIKDRDMALVQLRYQSSIRSQMEKEDIQRTLSKWAHSGFQSSRAKLQTTANSGANSPIASGQKSIADF